jgi:hypothetical protein
LIIIAVNNARTTPIGEIS